MNKIYSVAIIGILIISGYTVFASPNSEYNEENIFLNFSNLNMIENNEFISLQLEGTNSVFVKKDNYILPIYEKTINSIYFGPCVNLCIGVCKYGTGRIGSDSQAGRDPGDWFGQR